MIKLVLLIFILMLSLPTRELFALENLVKNPGFEEGITHWQVKIRGDWANKVSQSQIVSISTDTDSGKHRELGEAPQIVPRARVGESTNMPRSPFNA